ncbi:MAG: hypothetical protein QM489_00710 [Candidatus Izemoplasma sp.]
MGGQAIKKSDRVLVNNVIPIIESFCNFYNINKNKLTATGSTASAIIRSQQLLTTNPVKEDETIGDIDLIFDTTCYLWDSLTTIPGNSPREILFKYLLSVNPSLEYYFNHSAQIISLAYYIDGKKYQIDLICTMDVKFSLWMYGDHRNQNSNYKNLYRNSLLSACSHFVNYKSTVNSEQRFLFNYSSGLHYIKSRTRGYRAKVDELGPVLKNPKEMHRQFISKDPDTIIQLLLGNYSLEARNFRSFESVWEFLIRNVDYEIVQKIKDKHIVYLTKNNYDLPSEYKSPSEYGEKK